MVILFVCFVTLTTKSKLYDFIRVVHQLSRQLVTDNSSKLNGIEDGVSPESFTSESLLSHCNMYNCNLLIKRRAFISIELGWWYHVPDVGGYNLGGIYDHDTVGPRHTKLGHQGQTRHQHPIVYAIPVWNIHTSIQCEFPWHSFAHSYDQSTSTFKQPAWHNLVIKGMSMSLLSPCLWYAWGIQLLSPQSFV